MRFILFHRSLAALRAKKSVQVLAVAALKLKVFYYDGLKSWLQVVEGVGVGELDVFGVRSS